MPSTSYTQRTGSAGSRPVQPVEQGERLPRGTLVLGFWAAVATAVTYLTFEIGLLLDPITPSPWNVWVPIGASALIAPSFLLLTVGVHYAAPAPARLWTHSSMLFATIYAALAELVYVTWLFVVEPRVIDGTEDEVNLLLFEQGSFVQMVDAAAYTFMGIAVMMAAPAFTGWSGRWPRWFAVANGPAAVLAFISYVTYELAFGAPAGLLMPAYAISVAFWFRRRAHDDLPLPVRDPSWEVGDFHGAMVFDPATRPGSNQPVVPRSSGKSSAR